MLQSTDQTTSCNPFQAALEFCKAGTDAAPIGISTQNVLSASIVETMLPVTADKNGKRHIAELDIDRFCDALQLFVSYLAQVGV